MDNRAPDVLEHNNNNKNKEEDEQHHGVCEGRYGSRDRSTGQGSDIMQGGTYPRSNPANLWAPTTRSVMVIAHADDLVVNHEPTNQKQQR